MLRSSSAMIAPLSETQALGNYEDSEIQSLFRGGKVLITGATGFVGKVLVEFLLRKTATKRIYILVRPKKNKTAEERMKDMLNDMAFKKLKSENLARMSAITLVNGDCSKPELGMSNDDQATLLKEVNIIFHAAATVRFNENLKTATEINVTATRMILEIARKMKNLRVVMHISTLYTNLQFGKVFEIVYPVNKDLNLIQLMKSVDIATAHNITNSIIGDFPNTYVFTKRVAENIIKQEYPDLPIGIFRPGIVIGALEEPSPGYVDNLYGPTGLAIQIMSGIVHCLLIGSDDTADIVPVDYVVNGLIASAWETYTRYVADNEYSKIPVYNFSPHPNSTITWGHFADQVVEYGRENAPTHAIWYSFLWRLKSRLLYRILTTIFHYIPAWIGDIIMKVLGRKPRWTTFYEKTDELEFALNPFNMRSFFFNNQNVQSLWNKLNKKDKELFPFSLENFNWRQYFDVYLQGVRIYMMKENVERKLDAQRSKRLLLLHYALVMSTMPIWGGVIYWIYRLLRNYCRNV